MRFLLQRRYEQQDSSIIYPLASLYQKSLSGKKQESENWQKKIIMGWCYHQTWRRWQKIKKIRHRRSDKNAIKKFVIQRELDHEVFFSGRRPLHGLFHMPPCSNINSIIVGWHFSIKLIILIPPPQLGHSKGSTSYCRKGKSQSLELDRPQFGISKGATSYTL